MSENARVSGKKRHQRDQLKEREAAMAKASATPSTPPQDPPAQPAAEPTAPTEPKAVEPTSTPEPGKPADTDPPKTEDPKPAFEVDYKSQYRKLSDEHRKLKASHETLKGKYNKAEQDLKQMREENAQLKEAGAKAPSHDRVDEARETDAYKAIVKDWDEETAENFAKLAAHMAKGQTPVAAEPATPSEPEPLPTPGSEPEDPFFVALDNRLPGWDLEYNDNPEFVNWIKSNFEPFSGESYQALLERAQSDNDVNAALRIFSAFDRSRVSQNTDTNPEAYIEPANTGGEGTTQPEAPTYEADYLTEQERLLQRKKISREEFYKRRNEFIKAHQEGRVKTAA